MFNFHVSGHIWRFASLSSRPGFKSSSGPRVLGHICILSKLGSRSGFKSSSLDRWCWVTSGEFQVSAQELDSRVHLVCWGWFASRHSQVWALDLDLSVHLWSTGAGFMNATGVIGVSMLCLSCKEMGSLVSTVLGFYLPCYKIESILSGIYMWSRLKILCSVAYKT